MNVSCTSCSAKYAVPDEKVRGKKVKITCKHCGTGIIVDGTKIDAAAPAAASAAATASPAPSPAAAQPAPAAAPAPAAPQPEELRFDVAYPDERQESLSVSEIVDKYASGALDDEAFIWREGMPDWKAPFDIPQLASALTARGLKKKEPAPAAATSFDDDEATKVQESPFDGESDDAPAGEWREPAKEAPSSPAAAFNLTPRPADAEPPAASPKPAAASPKPAAVAAQPAAEASKPVAARRAAARGGGDLFGDLAAAGSEADESLGTDIKDAGSPKLTGARNESSVLFSLDALVKQEQPAAKKPAPKEDAAAILLGTDTGPNSMANLGTGQFGSAFAAPDFTAPVTALPLTEARAGDPVELPTGAPKKKGGAGLWIGLGVVVLAVGGAFAAGLPAKLMGTPADVPSASPAATPEQPAAAPTAEAEAAAPSPAPEASATASAAASPAPAGGDAPAAAPAGGSTPVAAAAGADSTATAAAKPDETVKPAEAKPAEAKPEAKPAEAKPTAPAESTAPPFDRNAAVAALTAAAGSAQSCKTPDGPTGSGKVSITFMPSGRATNTQVSGDLAGTAVGGCVARVFRSAKVPPFSGDAVTVSKSFTVQ